ncbi:MAG TPA: AAA family ATPase [Methylotenera sp.]|jgi:ATP-dependent Lon protease
MSIDLKVVITDKVKLEKRVQELKRRDEGVKARMAPILKQLWNPERRLAMGADNSVFDDLQTRFPNFSQVIQYWRLQASISKRLGTSFQSSPVLLGGDPGLGKTYFSHEAAKAMDLHYAEVNMSTVTASFVLSGGSLQWSEGSIGMICRTVAESQIANPMILLDEIDKASGGYKYDVLGPFYPLMEKHSAMRFKDEALDLELDASNINWIMTANNIANIPAPILSRAKLFHIEQPTREQMPLVIRNIYAGIRNTEAYGSLLDENLPDETVAIFDGLSPRAVKRKLTEACSKAFLGNRSTVMPDDVQVEQFQRKTDLRMGFI